MDRDRSLMGWIAGALLVMTSLLVGCGQSAAQFPSGPITMIIPYGTGSGSDIVGRELARTAEQYLGQSVMVVNKDGGGGAIGIQEFMAAKPDGYTVASASGTALIALKLQGQSTIGLNDVEYLNIFQSDPACIFQSAKQPWKSLNEAVDYAKANPGKLKIGTPSKGSFFHLLAVMFSEKVGIKTTIVPFTAGVGEAALRAAAGDVDLVFGGPTAGKAQADAGAIRAIAVLLDQRYEELAEVPTLQELGIKVPVLSSTRSMIVHKGIPQPALGKLRDSFSKAAQDPEYVTFLKQKESIPLFVPGDKALAYYEGMEPLYREALSIGGLLK